MKIGGAGVSVFTTCFLFYMIRTLLSNFYRTLIFLFCFKKHIIKTFKTVLGTYVFSKRFEPIEISEMIIPNYLVLIQWFRCHQTFAENLLLSLSIDFFIRREKEDDRNMLYHSISNNVSCARTSVQSNLFPFKHYWFEEKLIEV